MKPIAVIPVYNEKTHIGSLLDRFPSDRCDLVVIDDGSTDGTSDEIRARRFPVIRHDGRSGVGKCLQDGIAYGQERGYDAIVVMAGNGKDDPREIPKLLDAIEQGADYAQGSRFMAGGEWKNLPWQRWMAIKILTLFWSLVFGRRMTDVTNGFRAYRMSLLERPEVRWRQQWLQTYEFEYYLHYRALRAGVAFQEVPVTKNYPSKTNYSKIRPGRDWICILKPIFLLMTGIKD
ncbi:MAG TPA: glycosyltransferase family 2 protein [Elusimicrobiota bacterium]|nr:glycosyltransferase family 2 protein [Elusimicrobiota bacterium]